MKRPFEPIAFPFDNQYIQLADFVNDIAVASERIGAFNEKIKQTQVGYTYSINHMLRLESLYSTKIEGTQTTIDAVYESDTEKQPKNVDINEVLKYNEALNLASGEVINSPITIKLIKRIHQVLLSGDVRKNSNLIAGEFRTQQNRVGEHIPPVAVDVEKWMGNLERYINNDYGFDDKLPAIVKAALIHAQFETIHPFPDGNGRVGRVLIPLYLYKQKVIFSPYFFLSQELERQSIKYYSYLQGTRNLTADGFTNWIKFFLNSIIKQTNRDIEFIDSLDDLFNHTVSSMKSCINTVNVETVVKAIFKNPVFTIDMLYKETAINKNSLRKYVNILCEKQIIYSNQSIRNVRYYFMELLDLMK